MLIKISDIPSTTKISKILLWDKIPKKCYSVDGIPQNGESTGTKSILTKKMLETLYGMAATCLKADGFGLHCSQIGIPKRVFLIRENDDFFRVYFNAQWESIDGAEMASEVEGCLSIPGISLLVPRPTKIKASWYELNEEGFPELKIQELTGLQARAFCHEKDHEQFKTIFDRVKNTK